MSVRYNSVMQLTSSSSLSETDERRLLNDFSYEFGWTPSDRLEVPAIEEVSSIHLVVEHGLENQAVISFLKKPHHELSAEEQRGLLSISYNNLVDWHVQIQSDQVIYTFNRFYPFQMTRREYISKDNLDFLTSEVFQQIIEDRQNSNLPCLDDALIETISFWKRNLSAELGSENITNKELSSLFNAIIFVRAVEDNYRSALLRSNSNVRIDNQVLLQAVREMDSGETFSGVIRQALNMLEQHNISQELIDFPALEAFNPLNRELLFDLIRDFYKIKHAKPYEYDFSLMSKHALSRIYEKYTSVLKRVESDQLSLLTTLPEESNNRALGSIYTPQFIARFFSRYLREQVSHYQFRRLKTLEPSVGSGIFLRTLLEYQCDLTQEGVTTELIKQAFNNVVGVDIDPNACHATILSLSLLHLVLTNQLPLKLNIHNCEAITYYQEQANIRSGFNAVISNPPFISLGDQAEEVREQLSKFIGNHGRGKLDYYLAFLKIALDALEPGGYGLFIIPHGFLVNANSGGIRKLLISEAWIRCIVDLSGVKVFPEVDTYVVLLIFQKKFRLNPEPKAMIAQCRALVSEAFHAVLEDRETDTKMYTTFKVNQSAFNEDTWPLLPPSVWSIHQKLKSLPKISNFMDIKVGVQTGSNKVFIFDEKAVPTEEIDIFIPYLPDKEMLPYSVPKTPSQYLFYPYRHGRRLSSDYISKNFPKTWKLIAKQQEILNKRSAVQKNQIEWWQLERPRHDYIKMPKILTPHLVIRPRFSLDLTGQYGVIRSPVILPKRINARNILDGETLNEGVSDEEISKELLKYFVAILNSTVCYRYISENANRYGGGYTMLEPKRLQDTPVPDPKLVAPKILNRLISLVDIRLEAKGKNMIEIEEEIDNIVSNLYGLTRDEAMSYQIKHDS
ncbi:Eco57I restriction-modification methylase domain-containing protein [Trichocoleus sp. FACHB-262]|uniref:Eco57I restriction-modification methylase domain-containing protein n=1 Tax=Trichocoleus sp. FACHB-262 TaxID=2692869 RepID=UPI0016842B39|nr:N-6 DNA methylase [Trichocoleus sp. FACHB-262]MBD2122403.1 SAM-dependent DNA methyltransferase [Trichocoleus sp. FACHB-262]